MGATASKDDPNAQTFGFVFGKQFYKENGGGGIGVGHAGHATAKVGNQIEVNKRDYTVMASNVDGQLLPGEGFWVNYYLVVGSRDHVIQNEKKYAGRVSSASLDFTEHNTGLTPLYLDSRGLLTRQKQGDAKQACRVYNKPITNSQPLFRISEVPAGGKSMITIDPYALSYKTPWTNVLPKDDPQYKKYNNRDTMLVHLSQAGKPLHWTLLGFVILTDRATMDKARYIAVPGIDTAGGEQAVLARK